jgi:hypothetical protein
MTPISIPTLEPYVITRSAKLKEPEPCTISYLISGMDCFHDRYLSHAVLSHTVVFQATCASKTGIFFIKAFLI